MNIRSASTGDIPTIVTYNLALARETEDYELDQNVVTRGVTRGLEQGGDEVRYFVAEAGDGGDVVGQLMLTREWSDWRDGWLAWVQSVYVHTDFRGQGVFRSLLNHVEGFCAADPEIVGIRLYVEAKNERAQTVYKNLGFTDPRYRVLEKKA